MIKQTLTALALAATVAQPAAAGNDDIIKLLTGVIVGAALIDTLNNNRQNQQTTTHTPQWDGHIQNQRNYPLAPQVCNTRYDNHGSFVDVYHYDCRGRILRVDTYLK
jgi:hypothetical protein